MPYKSDRQRKYIHAQAAKGVRWAKKFVKDADEKVKSKGKRAKTKP